MEVLLCLLVILLTPDSVAKEISERTWGRCFRGYCFDKGIRDVSCKSWASRYLPNPKDLSRAFFPKFRFQAPRTLSKVGMLCGNRREERAWVCYIALLLAWILITTQATDRRMGRLYV